VVKKDTCELEKDYERLSEPDCRTLLDTFR